MIRTRAKVAAAIAAIGMLAACSSSPPPPLASGPQSSADPPRPSAPASSTQKDQCGASDLAYLVGAQRSQIPVPVDPNLRRVACTSCPVTMDFNPRRLNIFFDAETGVIKEVKCG